MRRTFLSAVLLAVTVTWMFGQQRPGPYQPTPGERKAIQAKAAELSKRIAALRDNQADQYLLADIEVHHKAAEWILRYPEEFFRESYVQHTLDTLDIGLARAAELARGKHSWTTQKGRLARAYRSRVDGSIQPYALLIPDSYDGSRPVRLDVVLHGRNSRLTEAWFIATHSTNEAVPESQNYIQLEVFGRTNNAYRWSGETDVWEALAAVERDYNIDPDLGCPDRGRSCGLGDPSLHDDAEPPIVCWAGSAAGHNGSFR